MSGSYLWVSLNLSKLLFKLPDVLLENLHDKAAVLKRFGLRTLNTLEYKQIRILVYEDNKH